jgi:2-dehydropantoate 2-reductase
MNFFSEIYYMEHVFIIGAGAIGKVLAVCLKKAGKEVTLIRGSLTDGGQRIQRLSVQLSDGSSLEEDITVTTLSEVASLDGIIAITSKSYGNTDLALRLRGKAGDSPIVVMQNGLGVEEAFANFAAVHRCVLFVTAQTMDESTTRFKPVADCPIGPISGPASDLDAIVAALSTSHFTFRKEANIQPVIWQKAIINCVFNSVCPLMDIDNGIFHRDEAVYQLAKQIIAECISIAKDYSIQLNAEDVEKTLLQISKSSDGQLISTLQDIRHGRQTEIDTLNFAVARMAEKLGKGGLVPITHALGVLTKQKSLIALRQ